MRAYVFCVVLLLVLTGVSRSAHADTLVLANGDEIHGEIIEWTVDHVVIDHPQLGTIRIELDQLKLDTGTPPNPGLFGTRFLRGWSRRIDAGINGEQSESPSLNLTLGMKFAYADAWTRWRFNARYFFNSSSDDNDNNATVDLTRDWLVLGSRWYGYLAGRYQFDAFQDWKHRITITSGPGYHVVQTEKHTLDLLLGPAFTREFGDSQSNQAEVMFGQSYAWTISERQSFDFRNQFFLTYQPNAGDWRNFTTANWSLSLTERPALSLNVGIQNEYESSPESGDANNDLKYFLALGLDL